MNFEGTDIHGDDWNKQTMGIACHRLHIVRQKNGCGKFPISDRYVTRYSFAFLKEDRKANTVVELLKDKIFDKFRI